METFWNAELLMEDSFSTPNIRYSLRLLVTGWLQVALCSLAEI